MVDTPLELVTCFHVYRPRSCFSQSNSLSLFILLSGYKPSTPARHMPPNIDSIFYGTLYPQWTVSIVDELGMRLPRIPATVGSSSTAHIQRPPNIGSKAKWVNKPRMQDSVGDSINRLPPMNPLKSLRHRIPPPRDDWCRQPNAGIILPQTGAGIATNILPQSIKSHGKEAYSGDWSQSAGTILHNG